MAQKRTSFVRLFPVAIWLFVALIGQTPPMRGQTRLLLNGGSSIAPLAGTGESGQTTAGDALQSRMGSPSGIVYDAAGNLLVADRQNHMVVRISPAGTLSLVAGTGTQGFAGDGGPATAGQLNRPSSVAVATDGTVFIADTGNHRIRSVAPDGTLHTVAGGDAPGDSGDGGPATAARLRLPSGVAMDSDGSLLIADTGNHRIRRLTADGVLHALAGSGREGNEGDGGPALAATFLQPVALQRLPDGRLLIADSGARRIRAIAPDGTITAFQATALRGPHGLALDATGNLLVVDTPNQQIQQQSTTSPDATAVAGAHQQGPAAEGRAVASALDNPVAVAADAIGGFSLSDRGNHQIQHVALPTLNFGPIPAGKTSAQQALLLQNAGNTPLQVASVATDAAFPITQGGSCGTFPLQLEPQQECSLWITFHPTAQGETRAHAIVQMADGLTATALLLGQATAGNNAAPSVTTLTSDGSISYSGSPVHFTATVSGSLNAPPGGNVSLVADGNPLGTASLQAGSAAFAISSLANGQHTLHAAYSGDSQYASSTSAALTQTVVATPDFTLSASGATYVGTSSSTVVVPLTLLPVNGTLNRVVTLRADGLPTGFSAVFTPAAVTLAGDALAVELDIHTPVTLASNRGRGLLLAVAAGACLIPCQFRRRTTGALLCFVILGTLAGCGGGFRASSSSGTIGGSGATIHVYHVTVTASCTGVLGESLAHSVPIELDLTQ